GRGCRRACPLHVSQPDAGERSEEAVRELIEVGLDLCRVAGVLHAVPKGRFGGLRRLLRKSRRRRRTDDKPEPKYDCGQRKPDHSPGLLKSAMAQVTASLAGKYAKAHFRPSSINYPPCSTIPSGVACLRGRVMPGRR